MTTTRRPLTVTPVTGALGAVVEDAHPCDPDLDFDAVYGALLEHEVIFFPGADLTEEQHLAFGARFGTPSVFPISRLQGATQPTMTVITDTPDQRNAADAWHTDVTWTATPPKCALLQAIEVPDHAGDTVWCSATKAYDALSPRFQTLLSGLTATHDNEGFIHSVRMKQPHATELFDALRREYPPVTHPVVRTHPETAKRALMYAARFMVRIDDVSDDESTWIMGFLADHVKEPSFHCRWRWRAGDLAIWDERSTLHRAVADHFGHLRTVRRLEIDGDRPFFDPPS